MQHDHTSFYGFNEHDANEKSVYANLIYQSIIGSTNHKFKAGASFLYDRVDETFANQELDIIYRDTPVNSILFDRREFVPGVFMEYNYDAGGKFSAIAGLRLDHHNLFGPLYTPRLHLRYNATETTTFRVSGGRGIRLANLLTESTGVLASARQFVFTGLQTNYAYGYKPDMAWNYGVNLSQDFTLDYRPGSITVDYFFTDFENQVVLDMDYSTREARFFGLTGRSFSQSFQFQVDYELMRRFDLRMAYRWLDVQTDYTNGRLTRPLIPQHRAFVNLAYETKNRWKFDYTVQVLGKQRIPNTSANLPQYQRETYSTSYMLMNAQVTKDIKDKWSVYLGVENINNFTLDNPIVAADDPFGGHNNFDSSLVWGPIFGRMVYAGFRFRMN